MCCVIVDYKEAENKRIFFKKKIKTQQNENIKTLG
jgi:hypothetical protein